MLFVILLHVRWLVSLLDTCVTVYSKTLEQKMFTVFILFYSIANVFPQNVSLLIGNQSL